MNKRKNAAVSDCIHPLKIIFVSAFCAGDQRCGHARFEYYFGMPTPRTRVQACFSVIGKLCLHIISLFHRYLHINTAI